jgi:hypothetical protein
MLGSPRSRCTGFGFWWGLDSWFVDSLTAANQLTLMTLFACLKEGWSCLHALQIIYPAAGKWAWPVVHTITAYLPALTHTIPTAWNNLFSTHFLTTRLNFFRPFKLQCYPSLHLISCHTGLIPVRRSVRTQTTCPIFYPSMPQIPVEQIMTTASRRKRNAVDV